MVENRFLAPLEIGMISAPLGMSCVSEVPRFARNDMYLEVPRFAPHDFRSPRMTTSSEER